MHSPRTLDARFILCLILIAVFPDIVLAAGFLTAPTYPVERYPNGLAAADFNGDGHLDLATANRFSGSISVLLNKGDGTFGAPVDYATGVSPIFVLVADINVDAAADLVVFDYEGTKVGVLLGNGDGSFRSALSANAGAYVSSVAAGDFNGDGKPDLVVTGFHGHDRGRGALLLGNGDGTFQPPKAYETGAYPVCIIAQDFNRDGKLDLAVADDFSSASVSILLGNGDGTFHRAGNYKVDDNPVFITAADLNTDGKLDLVVANSYGYA